MHRDVIGLVALDFILRLVGRSMVDVAFVSPLWTLTIFPRTRPASEFQLTCSPTSNVLTIVRSWSARQSRLRTPALLEANMKRRFYGDASRSARCNPRPYRARRRSAASSQKRMRVLSFVVCGGPPTLVTMTARCRRLFSRLPRFSAFGPGLRLNTGAAAADRAPLEALLVAFLPFFSNGARFDVFSRRRTGCSASLLCKGRRGIGEAEGDERGGYKALHGVFSILGSFSATLLLSVNLHGGNPPKETRKLLIPNYSLVRVARCKSFLINARLTRRAPAWV